MTKSVHEITEEAVSAALAVVDKAFDGRTNSSDGPCGDKLAANLHDIIQKAVLKEFNRDTV